MSPSRFAGKTKWMPRRHPLQEQMDAAPPSSIQIFLKVFFEGVSVPEMFLPVPAREEIERIGPPAAVQRQIREAKAVGRQKGDVRQNIWDSGSLLVDTDRSGLIVDITDLIANVVRETSPNVWQCEWRHETPHEHRKHLRPYIAVRFPLEGVAANVEKDRIKIDPVKVAEYLRHKPGSVLIWRNPKWLPDVEPGPNNVRYWLDVVKFEPRNAPANTRLELDGNRYILAPSH